MIKVISSKWHFLILHQNSNKSHHLYLISTPFLAQIMVHYYIFICLPSVSNMGAAKWQGPYLFDLYFVNILPNILHIIYSYMTNTFLVRFLLGHSFNYCYVLCYCCCKVLSFWCNRGDFMKRLLVCSNIITKIISAQMSF